MIDWSALQNASLCREPFEWAGVDNLFRPRDAAALADGHPTDHFKTVEGHDGENGFHYEVRALIAMGAALASNPDRLSPA